MGTFRGKPRRNGRACGRQYLRSAICATRSKGPRGPAAGYGRHRTIYLTGMFGEQMKRVAGPVSLLLLVAAIGLAIAGICFFRHHEKELEQRAEAAFPGPWLQRGF